VSNSGYGQLKPINLADLAGNHLSSLIVVMTSMPASLITDHVITNHMNVPVGMRVTAPTARMFTFGALTFLLRGKSKTMTNVNRILNDIDLHNLCLLLGRIEHTYGFPLGETVELKRVAFARTGDPLPVCLIHIQHY